MKEIWRKLKYTKPMLLLAFGLMLFSCEQPQDSVIQSVNETNALLQNYHWNVEDFKVVIKDEDIPAPILWSAVDSILTAGSYDLDDMIFDASEMRKMKVAFNQDGKVVPVNEETEWLAGEGDYIASYFVFNERTIRLSNPIVNLNYKYLYQQDSKELMLTVTENEAASLISDLNEKLIDRISNRTPDKLGDLIASILYNNAALQKIINDAIVNMISGELDVINEINPEDASKEIAKDILQALQSVEWESELTSLLTQELEKITGIDPDETANNISQLIVSGINETLTLDNIYQFVVPYLENLVANPDKSSEQIAELITGLFLDIFNQEKLQALISSAWEEFTLLDDDRISEISDTLTGIIQDLWINEDGLSSLVLPFTQKIDETSLLALGALAQQTTDSIQVLVEKINVRFPDLNLNPDYENLNSTIKAIFIAAKPTIALVGGPEEAARDVANIVLDNFITTDFISNTFTSVIEYLQTINPDEVGEKVSAWLVNMEDKLTPELISFLKDLFSPVLEDLNPDYTAFKIAKALNEFITLNITKESVNNLVSPIIKAFTEINAEAVANFLALKILESDAIKENITEENITEILLPVLTSISETNVDLLAQNLINAVIGTGIFEDVITEERASSIIALIMYIQAWDNVKIGNNFKEATILLSHE